MNIEKIRDFWKANESDLLIDYALLGKRNVIKCTYIVKIASEPVQMTPPQLYVTSLLACLN